MAQLKDSLITGDLRVTGTIYGNVPLNDLVDADDLKAIEALSGTSGLLKKTASNTWTLDTNAYTTSSGVTSVTIATTSPLTGGSSTAITSTGTRTIALADGYGDTKNPYASKTARYVLAAPASAAGVPTFRALTNADVGLGNVENTKLSTWTGSSNITTIGTLSSGTVPWARLSGVPSSFTPATHNHDSVYVNVTGDTMTGYLTVSNSGSAKVQTKDTGSTGEMFMGFGSGHQNHGIYSYGYAPTASTWTSSEKWMVYRDGSGNVILNGNATSATGFASAKTIALTGNVTGSATGGNGSNGWSIATTIGSGVVTNAMLAGSIANGKLVNSKVTIAGNDVSLGGSLTAATLKTSLGLNSAMHYIGKATVAITDGSTTDPKIGGNATTLVSGDVIIDSSDSREYIWNGSAWELLGGDSSYKVTQTAVTDAAYSGSDTATTFVSAVTQNANGVITVTKRKLPTYNNYSHPTYTQHTAAAVKVGNDATGHVVIGAALTAADVGAAPASHTHSYLPLAGGTMTGVLKAYANQYTDDYTTCGINMQNSDIVGLNSIYTADASDNAGEGIHFYRDSTHVDTLWVNGGDILFVPNRALGTGTTKANSQKVGRFTANPTSGQVVVTDGTTGGIKSSGYTIAASVPSGAKFTDTTYSAGTGISLSGTTFSNSGVTGVKGNAESSYRTGQVNLTSANIGAVALSGDETVSGNKTFSGQTTLSPGSVYAVGANTKIAANSVAIIQSPIPKYLWHDLFAFSYKAVPTYYITTNNSTWTEATLDKRPFAQKENFAYQIIKATGQTGSRWVWHNGSFSYSFGVWLVIGVTYASPVATVTITFDTSSDGSTWTTRFTNTHNGSSAPIWCYLNSGGYGADTYLRLTITKDASDTTKIFNINAIKLLSPRWGDQGGGSEYEYPYSWDENKNVTFPAKVTATTLAGNLNWSYIQSKPTLGTLASKSTISNHSVTTPTGATSRTTDVAVNTTTVNSITAVGTLPSLSYTAKSIPNVTAAGTASYANGVLTITNTTLGTAIPADDITAWSAGTLPTKGSNTTVATGIKTQPTFTVTTTTTTLSHTVS